MRYRLVVICSFLSMSLCAQDKDSISVKGWKIFPQQQFPLLDTAKQQLPMQKMGTLLVKPIKEDSTTTMPIVRPDTSVIYSGQVKIITGEYNVIMPGTEGLDTLNKDRKLKKARTPSLAK